ncbi:phiSA1p31-related protein [Streptomyces europaeiscabiei]|uniref:phiSA1p31-related protein n=1 Tax=Streptomyces europaeiscabiei TaxID=146819 RepID=UPI002E264347|nr:phiSA1p31-related protein [Streptomyces europaeiscabiei]
MTGLFEFAAFPDPNLLHPSALECSCQPADDQYLMEIDCGAVSLVHKACGKTPGSWLDDAFHMARVPVTLHWHPEVTTRDNNDDPYGIVEINDLAVVHDNVPYLVNRHYGDCDGSVWLVTEERDAHGNPLLYLHPEGAGVGVALSEIVADFGPLTLITPAKENPIP